MISITPRPPVNQGVDRESAIVVTHTKIHDAALASITQNSDISFIMNPYGTAPLSGYAGVWLKSVVGGVAVSITNDVGAIPVSYTVTVSHVYANLIPILGLVPGAINHISVSAEGKLAQIDYIAPPLPPTDSEIPLPPPPADPSVVQEPPRYTGFPQFGVTVPWSSVPETLDELYFVAFNRRYHAGFDQRGTARWHCSLDIPSMTFERLRNGHFLAASDDFDNYRQLYEYDMVGRVHQIYVLDNRSHHSIYQLPNGDLLLNSENTGESVEDGLSVISLTTGLETAYYDLRGVMDTARPAVPSTANPIDWLHVNQAYLNVTNTLYVISARHQGLFGIHPENGQLAFILANHQDWAAQYQPYLLTPVSKAGVPLYDLSDPADIDRADKEFWPWGQHACIEVPNSTPGMVEFFVFDNGNWRSRSADRALLPVDNASRMVHYRINLADMTVVKVFEYGKNKVGSRGYSSYVSNAYQVANGNYLINFGGAIFDENGRALSQGPGYSDIVDPLDGEVAQGRIVLQEIDPATKTPLFEMVFTSGRFKTYEGAGDLYRVDLFSFRTRKLPMLP